MTIGLSEHSADPLDVFTSIQKHDQFHGFLCSHLFVVLLQVLLYSRDKQLQVSHLVVLSWVCSPVLHEVSEDYPVQVLHCLLFDSEVLKGSLQSLLNEQLSVFLSDQSVMVDSHVLVEPESL